MTLLLEPFIKVFTTVIATITPAKIFDIDFVGVSICCLTAAKPERQLVTSSIDFITLRGLGLRSNESVSTANTLSVSEPKCA